MQPIYQYKALVQRVIDGDTFVVHVDYGFNEWKHEARIRVRDFDTPEKNSENPLEVEHALEARDFMVKQLPFGTLMILQSAKTAVWDRWQAHCWYQHNGVWLSAKDVLAANGFAKRASY